MAFGKLKVRGRNEKTIEVQSTGGDSIIRVDTFNATSGEPAVTCTSDVTVAGASITVTGTGEKVTTPGLAVGAGDLTVTGGSITVTGSGEKVTTPGLAVGAGDLTVTGGSITVTGSGEKVTTPGLVVGAGGITAGTDAGVTLADSLILRGFTSDGTTAKVFTIKCVGGVVTVCSITDPA